MKNKKFTYEYELGLAVGKCKTLLDVGCGANSPIAKIKSKSLYTVGIDAHQPSIEKSKSKGIHSEYKHGNVLKLSEYFEDNSFDCVLASDLIEHLEKVDGFLLIEEMEKIASKRVIIFTPKGFLPQEPYDNNPFQEHKSGWEVEEMQKLGYKVIGINGLKYLRGERAKIKFKPKKFWTTISILSQRFVRNRPEKAFQILCVKDLK